MPRVVGLLQRSVQIYPHRTATRHEGRVHSWADFAGRVARIAGALLRLGLRPGDRVAIAARDSDRFAEAVFAVLWAGGVLQPVNLRLAARRNGDSILFAVVDDGPGIPEEYHDIIFRKFGQVHSESAPRVRSSGLGLTFCKLVVDLHGGRIWVKSNMGEGSSFYVELPRRPAILAKMPTLQTPSTTGAQLQ